MNAFAETAEKVLADLGVDPAQGLTAAEAKARSSRHGLNVLRAKKRVTALSVALDQFRSVIVWLLSAAALLSFSFGDIAEGAAIAIVIVINGAIGFVTEMKAVRSMEALHKLARLDTHTRRSGESRFVPAEHLAPGDIVILDSGDRVTADLRLIESANLYCDESTFTGESLPVAKTTEPLAGDTPLPERRNMAFKGTAVVRGSGLGVVTAIGHRTELGGISNLVEEAESEVSPLEERLDRLSRQLLWVTLGLTALITLIGMFSGKDPVLMVKTGIALAVAGVPEGLPIVATLVLARGMWRMAKRNVLIERLSAVETLGATTVIFTDKTGTLTENRMRAARYVLPSGQVLDEDEKRPDAGFDAMMKAAALCNNVSPPKPEAFDPAKIAGDPTEVALLIAAAERGVHKAALLRDLPEIREEAFDTETKMMATVHRTPEGGHYVAVKGAPEAVIARARQAWTEHGPKALSEADRDAWTAANRSLAADAFRVLALAQAEVAEPAGDVYADLTLLGLVGLYDPPRADVAPAIAECKAAGLRVVMVTGDQAATARAIADDLGLIEDGHAEALDAKSVKPREELTEEERAALLSTPVFARITPKQKLDLVTLYQDSGEIVAMTGDGVNDAPALKKADIGVAMGVRGTQVAKEAADMVLGDDAFSSIVAAVAQGRIIFANIRSFVVYLLSCNLSEILIVSVAAASGLPLPLLPLQILFLNLVTDVLPAFALGANEGDPGIMRRPPRNPAEGVLARRHWIAILGYALLMTAAVLGAFFIALGPMAMTASQAVTVSFLTLAFAQLWHVFNMRRRGSRLLANEIVRNPFIWAALVVCTGLLVAAIAFPPLAEVLRTERLELAGWALVIGASLVPLIAGQIGKNRKE